MPFVRPMGLVVTEARRGYVAVRMKADECLFSHRGAYQAGSLFTLAEVAGGVFVGTFLDLEENFLVTKRAEIDFLRPSGKDLITELTIGEEEIEKVLAELKVKKKMDYPVKVSVRSCDSEPVLDCRFIYYLRSGMPRALKR